MSVDFAPALRLPLVVLASALLLGAATPATAEAHRYCGRGIQDKVWAYGVSCPTAKRVDRRVSDPRYCETYPRCRIYVGGRLYRCRFRNFRDFSRVTCGRAPERYVVMESYGDV